MKIRHASGFALIDVLFVVGMIGLLSTIALPRLLMAQQSASAASAIGSMRAINSAQLGFALTCGGGFYAPRLTVLGTPPPGSNESFITASLGLADTVTHSNYMIQMTGTPFAAAPASCNGLAAGDAGRAFAATADPSQPGNVRFFATNANGLVWEHTATLWGAMPELGEPPIGQPLGSR